MMLHTRIIGTLLLGAAMSLATMSLIGCQDSAQEGDANAPSKDEAKNETSNRVTVTQEQAKRLGIKVSDATRGSVSRVIRGPGEIKVNSDRMAHVAPRVAGVVRQVLKTLGDTVKAGEPLAWIESDALAEAKLNFYAKETEVGCCEIELPRAKAIFQNVAKLTALLTKEASEAEIKKLDKLEMGKYRGLFLTSYSAYLAARTNHKREADLHAEKVSSGRELLAAETEMKQARSTFRAILDTARYETLVAYTEAAQERQVAVFHAVAAEKRLRLKGADDKVIAELRALVPKTTGLKPCTCDDPNCKDGKLPSVAEALRKDTRFNLYAMQSPFDGTVIAKHLAVGESIDETVEVFTVANLSSVWVDLAISQDNISLVQAGQNVTISLPDGSKSEGKIDFASPIISAESRTAMARVVLPNPTGTLRPGTFVDASIVIPSKGEAVLVPKSAIQLVFDHPCVFLWNQGAFELREIVPGIADDNQIEILSGLKAGDSVASAGAFHLKAEYIKSRAKAPGGCQGHSH